MDKAEQQSHYFPEGCHEIITGDKYFIATESMEIAVKPGKVGVFMVGGGAAGYRYYSGGASGYFKYQVVDVVNDNARINIGVGGGGVSHTNNDILSHLRVFIAGLR